MRGASRILALALAVPFLMGVFGAAILSAQGAAAEVPMAQGSGQGVTQGSAPGPMGSDSVRALEALTSKIAAELRCPVCQGLSIEDSPTELALEMRAVIRDQLAEGRTAEEVREYFVSKYGEWILLQPKPEGFNLAVYGLPLVMLVVGGGTVALAVRRWTKQGGGSLEGIAPESEMDQF